MALIFKDLVKTLESIHRFFFHAVLLRTRRIYQARATGCRDVSNGRGPGKVPREAKADFENEETS